MEAFSQAPVISYTPLSNTCSESSRTLIATITSPEGIPTSGAGLPVLYWSFNATIDQPVTGVSIGNNQYAFTFGAGAFAGSVISYYIVAQTSAATPSVSVYPSAGGSGLNVNPPSITTPPIGQDFYVIQPTLSSGTYLVGAGQVYTTITDAINAYNTSCLNGPVTFALTDATYGPAETFPIAISNPQASASNTLMIKPNTGITATITGSAEALFKYNGADYISFDGSNNGSTGRNMIIVNNSSSPSASVFWLTSFSATNGSSNNTIKNCNIYGYVPSISSTPTLFAGIAVSSGVLISSNADASNNNNSFINNNINTSYHGIYLNGALTGDTSNIISGNTIGSPTTGKKLGYRGIYISNQNNVLINNNTVVGINSMFYSGAEPDASGGIFVAGSISGGNINNNLINDIKNTSASGAPSYGISLQSTSSASNIRIYNNMLHNISAYGKTTSVIDNGIGITVLSGGGYGIYFNTVLLQANQGTTGITCAVYFGSNINGAIDLRNNIFSNRQTIGTRYSIYCNNTRSIFNTINYNDYHTTGYLGFLGDQISNIGQWQSATLADGGSVSVDPIFVNITVAADLHLQNASTLNDQGIPIAGITTDYDYTIRSTTTPDIGADEFTPPACTANLGGTASTLSSAFICVSGKVVLSCSGFSFGSGISYQWQSSTNNINWINIPGETNPTSANPPNITVTTYYRLRVICAAGVPGYSNTVTINVKNPTITSTIPAARCGTGSLTLTANSDPGTTIQWYSTATGGAPIATGNTYTTPVLNGTATFYAEPAFIGSAGTCGPNNPSAVAGTISPQLTPWNVYFDVINATTLASVDVYPMAVGDAFTIEVYNSSDQLIGTAPFITNVSGGNTAQIIPLNIFLQPGNDYYMYINPGESGQLGFGLNRNISGANYPYSSSDIVITGNGFNNTYYMCFYRWAFTNGCTVSRTPVNATIGIASSISLSATPAQICGGGSSVISATSSNGGYVYTWTPGGVTGNSITVSPTVNTRYIVNATDGNCSNTSFIDIFVDAPPTPITINPANPSFCNGSSATINTTGGNVSSTVIFNEKFEGAGLPPGWDTANTNSIQSFMLNARWQQRSSIYVYSSLANGTLAFKSNDSSKFFSAISDKSGSQILNTSLRTPKINLTGYSGAQLSFWHHYSPFFAPDSINVEYFRTGTLSAFNNTGATGTNANGTGWTTIYKTGPSTRPYLSSHLSMPGQITASSNPIGGTTNWVQRTIDLTPFLRGNGLIDTMYIRFRYVGKANFWWCIDNVQISGTGGAPIVWTPATGLYTNAAATTPYVAGAFATTVYAAPAASTTYTASSLSPNGCSASANVLVAKKPLVTAVVSGSNAICPGSSTPISVALTGTPPWRITYTNGTANTTVSGINSSPYVFNVSPAVNTTYTVTAVQDGGTCTAAPANITGSATITIASITASLSGNTSICSGNSATLSISLTGSAPWNLTYSNGGTPVTINGITTPTYNLTVSPTTTTTYSLISVTNSAGCAAPSANLTGTATVIVRALPTASISGTTSVCQGLSANLSIALTGSPPWNLTYTNGTTPVSLTGILTSPYNFSVTPAVTSTYSVTAQTDNNGCAALPSGISNTATVTVNPLVSGSISGDNTICEFGSTTLSISLTGTAPWTITYLSNGTNPIVLSSVASSPLSVTVSPSANTVYTVSTITDASGCIASSTNITGSASVAVNISGYSTWSGYSDDWMDPNNWCGGVPDSIRDVFIPSGLSIYPLIIGGTAKCNNLTIAQDASVIINFDACLAISGNTNNNGIIENYGRMLFNGPFAQTFPGGSTGIISIMNILEVNKNGEGADGTFFIDQQFKITDTGSIILKDASKVVLGEVVTLSSNAFGTARIDSVGNRVFIEYRPNGSFCVERFIPTGLLHGKSWQLLATPTFGQTINQSWQEGATSVFEDPNPGYGTTITSNLPDAINSLGFDFYTPSGASLKVYDDASNNYTGLPNTTNTPIANPKGYMFLVRGDRSVTTSSAPANPVTLRTTGKIYYGNGADLAEDVPVLASNFQSAGNPYASPIDFKKVLEISEGINGTFYAWDPLLQSYNGLGAFQTISSSNNWEPIPGGTTNYPSNQSNSRIQSGQAFFVFSIPGGFVKFSEGCKISGTQSVFRDSHVAPAVIKMNLLGADNSLLDGNMLMIDSVASKDIDEMDAPKLSNFGFNAAIKNKERILSLDAINILSADDTIYYHVANIRQQNYKLQFIPSHLPQYTFSGILVDNYTGIRWPVSFSDTTWYSFSVTNNPLSRSENRFYLIFKTLRPLPVSITDIHAEKKKQTALVSWTVSYERNIHHYEIERSADGRDFSTIGHQTAYCSATNTCSYQFADEIPIVGANYYRIKAVGQTGEITYTRIVQLNFESENYYVNVSPNPLSNQLLRIKINLPAGKYTCSLSSTDSKLVHQFIIAHSGGVAQVNKSLNNQLAAGTYLLKLTNTSGRCYTVAVVAAGKQ